MRRIVNILLLLISFCKMQAQMHNAQWVHNYYTATTAMDVNEVNVKLDSLYSRYKFESTSNICNKEGELLFICDGIRIFDKNHQLLPGGDSISPSPYTWNDYWNALSIQQATLFIPMPGNDSLYYLFHYTYDTFNNTRPHIMYYSLLNSKLRNGLGDVVAKNQILYAGPAFSGCRMTACKHGNGRDYWLVWHGWNNNRIYKFLVTADGLEGPFIQDIGPNFNNGLYDFRGQSSFSSDGTLFVTGSILSQILLLEFDRCTGEFSNPRTRWNNDSNTPLTQPISGTIGLEFSPNGAFIYCTTAESGKFVITQYEVEKLNLVGDSVKVSTTDTIQNNEQSGYRLLHLAPNGKIYIAAALSQCYGAFLCNYLHVINQPNEKGASCGFGFLAQEIKSFANQSLTNTFNYRLGAKGGSSCDTLVSSLGAVLLINNALQLAPNPATTRVKVSARVYIPNATLNLTNALGKAVLTASDFYLDKELDISHLAAGVYFVTLSNATLKAVSKLVVE